MSQEAMYGLLNVAEKYASPSGTFIRMFGKEKPPYELLRFSTDKLVMKEAAYDISIGLSKVYVNIHKSGLYMVTCK